MTKELGNDRSLDARRRGSDLAKRLNKQTLEVHNATFTAFVERSVQSFLRDPPDTDFQRGYQAAMIEVRRRWKELS